MPDSADAFDRELELVLAKLHLGLTSRQLSQLRGHHLLLRKWNKHVNLSGIKNPREVAERHFGEALFLAQRLGVASGSLVDVGSGAGFPGVPIAVVIPGLRVTLVESVAKKAAFLKEVARLVTNVSIFHGRLEDVGGWFDWATFRAVGPSVLEPLGTLVGNVAVLTVDRDCEHLAQARSAFQWQNPEKLPWGRQRTALIGINAGQHGLP